MFDVYLIEVRDAAVGVVTRDGDAYRFHASDPAFTELEGQRFVDAQHAERSARRLVSPDRPSRRRAAPMSMAAE